jgi:hypothetical protein
MHWGRWTCAAFGIVALGCGGGSSTSGPSPDSATAPSTTALPAGASMATTLASFEGSEEPTVLYFPGSQSFRSDGFVNMTSPSAGLFHFELRYRYKTDGWWDGDRDTTNDDRQRAEVKGLGVHQRNNQTFEYGTTWRTSRGGAGKFWHVFQLKATDGDDAPPLVVNSIQSSSGAAFRYWPGDASNFIVARTYTFAVNTFTTIRIRVRTSISANGEVRGSVNGDALAGATNVAVYRPDATDYRPKWGSYRGVDTSDPYGDDFVEHRDVWAARVGD